MVEKVINCLVPSFTGACCVFQNFDVMFKLLHVKLVLSIAIRILHPNF